MAAQEFLDRVVDWAAACPGVLAVGLAGSWARGTATPTSDVDLVVVVDDIAEWLRATDWMGHLGECLIFSDEDWGAVTSRRVHYAEGLEVEYGLTAASWAGTPLDHGTAEVIDDGFQVLTTQPDC